MYDAVLFGSLRGRDQLIDRFCPLRDGIVERRYLLNGASVARLELRLKIKDRQGTHVWDDILRQIHQYQREKGKVTMQRTTIIPYRVLPFSFV